MALTDNLVAFWRFNESSGNASDSSGSGFTLTNTNTVGYSAGLIGNAADFGATNTNKYFTRGSVGLNTKNTGTYSISLWYYMQTAPAVGELQTLAAIGGDSATGPQQNNYYYNDSGTYKFLVSTFDGVSGYGATVNNTLSTNAWNHIVIVKNTTNYEVYVNGSSVGSTTNNTSNSSPSRTAEFSISKEANGASHPLKGLVDLYGVWAGKALSSAEVTELYSGGAGYDPTLPAVRRRLSLLGVS